MGKKIIYLILGIVLVLLTLETFLIFIVWAKLRQIPATPPMARQAGAGLPTLPTETTHLNAKYRFTFNYPSSWTIQGLAGQNQDVGLYPDYIFVTNQDAAGLPDGSGPPKKAGWLMPIETASSEPGKTFEKASSERVLQCGADSPGASASCDKIIRQRQFTSQNGLAVLEFYVNLKTETCPVVGPDPTVPNKTPCQTSQKEIGPIYFLDAYDQTGGQLRAIEIKPEFLDANALATPAAALLAIAQSIKFY